MAEDAFIKSVSYSQDEILRWILRLHVKDKRFDADVTYSRGGFYKEIPQPRLCFDIDPQFDHVIPADCRCLPLTDGALESIVIDPPFLATTGKSLQSNAGNVISRRFTVCRSEKELASLYQQTIREAFRVLADQGVLIFKCQDKVSSGKQYMMHCSVYEWAVSAGFIPIDLFILLAKTRIVANWQRNQKHARKYHSYFWVFRKAKQNDRLQRKIPNACPAQAWVNPDNAY